MISSPNANVHRLDRLPAGPREFHFSRADYYRMVEQGVFHGRRAELIHGRIIEISPQDYPHSVTIELLDDYLRSTFKTGYRIRIQSPLKLHADSDPEPDVAVIKGSVRTGADHPASAVLVVEVSDSSLEYDRRKARIYANNGIGEYWIVNLIDRVIEVYRQPVATSGGKTPAYASRQELSENDFVSPLAAPRVKTAVKRLLPAAKTK